MTHQPTTHVLYKNMIKIKNHLKEAANSGPNHLANLIDPMQEKFDKYWDLMKEFAKIVVVFDPRYKIDIIEFNLLVKCNLDKAATACEMGEMKKRLYFTTRKSASTATS